MKNSRISRKLFIIPALYIIIVGALIYLHFQPENGFQSSIGNITASGRARGAPGNFQENPKELSISLPALSMSFQNDDALYVETADGAGRSLSLTGFTENENGFTLSFDEQLQLSFTSGGEDDSRATISIDANKEVTTVYLPWQPENGYELYQQTGTPVLHLTGRSGGRLVALSPGASLMKGRNQIALPLLSTGPAGMRITDSDTRQTAWIRTSGIAEPGEAGARPFKRWLQQAAGETGEQEYRETVEKYINAAYRGWREERFNRQEGTWQMPGGQSRFSEKILTATLAESLERTAYTTVLRDMRNAAEDHRQALSSLSNSYLGNLIPTTAAFLRRQEEKISQYKRLIRAEDPALFLEDDLLQKTLNAGEQALLEQIAEFADRLGGGLEPEKPLLAGNLPASEVLLGLANCYLEARDLDLDSVGVFRPFAEITGSKLEHSLYRFGNEIFLLDSDHTIAPWLSLRFGMTLQAIAALPDSPAEDPEYFASLGRTLVVSALSRQDEYGFLPAAKGSEKESERTAESSDSGSPARSSSAGPAEVYPLISGNNYYPHAVSLNQELGPGYWLWTTSNRVRVEAGPDRIRLRISFPVDGSHHFTLHGITEFEEIQIFNIPWKSDPNYEIYSTGWRYDRENEALHIKLRHRSPEETIDIYFEAPEREG
ncbi:MAG: hypothetical protein K9L68_05610 [Spirochaetales bacterium]|nr:hypothetical protein [Spirochaetales bacterium]MCF7938056.1 hypothetical protein [Spirochaetales bacterium]